MGTLIGFMFGLGVVLMVPDRRTPRKASPSTVKSRSLPGGQLLRPAGVQGVGAGQLWVMSAGAWVLVAVLATAATGVVVIAVVVASMSALMPIAMLRARALRRRRDFAAAWPDAVDHLASGVRAGLSLPEALIGLSERGPVELREPFAAFGRDYLASGKFGQSLDLLKSRLADPTGDRVVEALRLARDVGGTDLGRLLRSLSGFLRDEQRTRGELESRQSWTVVAARVAVGAPWIVLLLMSLEGEVLSKFARPAGALVLVGGAAACVAAYWLMLRLGRLPEEHRVLS